jgi:hypothetical protein
MKMSFAPTMSRALTVFSPALNVEVTELDSAFFEVRGVRNALRSCRSAAILECAGSA